MHWTQALGLGNSILGMLASIAVIWTAWLFAKQLKMLKTQMSSGDENHLQGLMSAKDTALGHMHTTREVNKNRATLDVLLNQQSSPTWAESRGTFVKLRDHNDGLQKYALKNDANNFAIRLQLNRYELIAIGIYSGILDKQMYADFFRSTFVKDYNEAILFIEKERQGKGGQPRNPRFWMKFEALAKEFIDDEIAEKKHKL